MLVEPIDLSFLVHLHPLWITSYRSVHAADFDKFDISSKHLDILVARRGGQFSYIEACSVLTCLRVSQYHLISDSLKHLTLAMEKRRHIIVQSSL